MSLTPEQLADLEDLEKRMRAGACPFVRCPDGQNWAFAQELLDAFSLVSGQVVSRPTILALMKANVERLQRIIAAH